MPEVTKNPDRAEKAAGRTRCWFTRLPNRRVYMSEQVDGTFYFRFKRYDPNRSGRKRDRIIETKIAFSDEALGAMAMLYIERGKSYVRFE